LPSKTPTNDNQCLSHKVEKSQIIKAETERAGRFIIACSRQGKPIGGRNA